MKKQLGYLLVVVLCLATLGCSEAPPYELSEVRGSVTLDGKPLTNREGLKFKVMFTPIAQGESSMAGKPGFSLLSDDGTYQLSSYSEGDGAVVGKHWVTLIRTQLATGDSPETYKAAKYHRYRIPTPQVVEPGIENVIDLQVTSAQLER